jgi:phenylpropionate dioxygenase-like ring-hydroxylating dioxygenase large terminal subunit
MGTVVGDAIQCPYHGWQWDGASGRCKLIPAVGPDGPIPPAARLTTYQSHERYGLVWATLSEDPVDEIPVIEEIEELALEGDWASGAPWDVTCNVCVAIENFRDVAHFPFVHYKTMGVLPHEVEPLKPARKGFHAYLERVESQFEKETSDPVWEATHPGTITIKYHAVAPSVVSVVMESADVGTRAIVFAVAPTSLYTSRWYFTEAVTAGVPESLEELLKLGRAITEEDITILERVRPQGFEGMPTQVHCVADAYTLKYRDAFMAFVREASGGE